MADFHTYQLTAVVKIAVPADASGNAATFDLNSLPTTLRAAVEGVATLSKAAVGVPNVVLGTATPVTV